MENHSVRIKMLGGLQIEQDGRSVTRFSTKKAALLLARLACPAGKQHAREELVGALWPESDEDAGRQSLRQALASLRRVLEPPGVAFGSVLIADRAHVRLALEAVTTDVGAFESAIRAGRADEAAQNYGGDFLPGVYDDWVLRERDRLADAYQSALTMLGSAQEKCGDWQAAIESAHRALACAPADEAAHLNLMELYRQAGRPDDARRQFARLQAALTDWDDTPSEAAAALLKAINDEAPSRIPAPETRPPKSAPRTEAARLPVTLTRFFGRGDDISTLTAWLSDPETRLVTLVGPGGVGKTRLSLETARRLVSAFDQSAVFVPLADLTDANLMFGAVAAALRLPPDDARAQIAAALQNRPLLLVLDNLEQMDGASEIVEILLSECSDLTVLATSRHRLGVGGERVFSVTPLPTPTFPAPPETLDGVPSVRLFVARAQEIRPDFQLTPRNAAAVAALCERLEGLPLALELAAAWIGALTPAQMLQRLEQRFELLVSRQKGVGARHRTLRAAIEWSWHLLTETQQQFFVGLTVFRGGWTLEAAERVCGVTSGWELLAGLQERSLIVSDEIGDEMRCRLLESLREWGDEQLDASKRDALARRHAEWCAGLLEDAYLATMGPNQAAWWERLTREQENFRAALAWARVGDPALMLRMAPMLARFWIMRGLLREGRAELEDILARTDGETGPARARALFSAALHAFHQQDLTQAECWFRAALNAWETLGETGRVASALNGIGMVASERGDFETARRFYRRSLGCYRQAGDLAGVATVVGNLGDIARAADGNLPLARRCYLQTIALLRAVGNTGGVAHFLRALGEVAARQGDWNAADVHFDESLIILRGLNDKSGLAETLTVQANAHRDAGNSVSASRLYREALTLCGEMEKWHAAAEILRACAGLQNAKNDAVVRLERAAAALQARPSQPADARAFCAPILAAALAADA